MVVLMPPQRRKTRKFCGVRKTSVGFAVSEDLFLGDLTTESVLRRSRVVSGKIVCLESCVLAGVEEVVWTLGKKNCSAKAMLGDGLKPGAVVFTVKAKAPVVLGKIRTALNYLSRLSGLATNARRLENKFGKNRIAALRKTTPGLGASEKVALQVGGVMAHRVNLGDGILIKKEHLSLVQQELGGTKPEAVFEATRRAVGFVRKNELAARGIFVEVEVESLSEALEAARAGPGAIMIDNKNTKEFSVIASRIKMLNNRIVVEASGEIAERDVASYFRAGADVVSGSFVFDARPINFRFIVDRVV